jgi:hypothetical protein
VKRGWISWDETELPRAAFEARLSALRRRLEERDLPAAAIYTDVWRSNRVRYFSNFMPYWNRALLVVPRGDGNAAQPVLLCALSPRVYPWIRSVTILEDIRSSPNLPKALAGLAAEKGWKRVGVLDLSRLPADIRFDAGLEITGVSFPHVPDEWELAMYRKAAQMAREGLLAELAHAVGQTDRAFIARLEKRFRRAGAEDLVILLTNGRTVPAPARGETLGSDFSVSLALEYRGHWVRIGRSASARDPFPSRIHVENLSGPYPYEPAARLESPAIMALRFESQTGGLRLFHGDTYHSSDQGLELL